MARKTKKQALNKSLLSRQVIHPENIGLSKIGTDGKRSADIVVEQHDADLYRLDNPWMDEVVPIDHRTVLGTLGGIPEMLGLSRVSLVRKHLGERCRLCTLRAWLYMRRINPSGMNWTDFCSLLRKEESRK